MNRKITLAVLIGTLVTPFLVGQDRNHRFGDRKNSGQVFRFFGPPVVGSTSMFRSHIGVFPRFRVSKEMAAILFAERFLFGGYPPARVNSANSFFEFREPRAYYWGDYGYGAGLVGTQNYDSQRFVDEWKNREPLLKEQGPDLTQSTLLSEGMSEEEVVKRLGSPIQRIQLGQRQIWKYSSYSLLFDGGALKEIR